jgi:iron complex outermembrane receptor protein
VIRGPGAALWCANAVDGVINIITRKARDTQGDLLVGAAGSTERALGEYRHGGESDEVHYRVWAKAFSRDPSVNFAGEAGNDDWRATRVGFRRDWSQAAGSRFTLSGEAYAGPTGDRWNIADMNSPVGFTPTDINQTGQGGHLLGRPEWRSDNGAESALQSYLSYDDIDVKNAIHQKRTTADVDFQRRAIVNDSNDFIWGVGYRYSVDHIDS